MDVISYKCPCCTAPLVFSGETQQMVCNSCGNTFTVEQVQQYDAALKEEQKPSDVHWTAYNEHTADEAATGNMRVYTCPSCGAEIVGDENTMATHCVYCGNETILAHQLEGMLYPDYVIPFKLNKEDAKAALKQFYNKKPLLPKTFKDENQIDKLTGIYVPFWLFGCDADAHMTYDATRTTMWSDTVNNYTKTDHYLLTREGSMSFEKVPVDGSEKMQDEMMDAIEPFDFGEAVPFSTAYLSGFYADRYDVDSEKSKPRAAERIKASMTAAINSTVSGYVTVSERSGKVNVKNGDIHYALLPVWMLNTKYNDKNYLFAMNGQTGKLIGDLPVSKGKYWGWLLGVAGALMALAQLVIFLVL